MAESKHSYNCVDLLKFFFCVCIITMHTNGVSFLPDSIEYMLEKCVFRLAVPFFFMCSGFFLMKKFNAAGLNTGGVLRQYTKRLLRPYIFWQMINCLQQGITLLFQEQLSLRDTCLQILQHLIFNPYGALWYVWAVIWLCSIIRPFVERDRLDWAISCGTVLYLIGLLANRYYFVACDLGVSDIVDAYRAVFMTNRNSLFVGMIYFSLGMKSFDWISEFKVNKKISACLLFFYMLYAVEIIITHSIGNYVDDGAYYIFQVPVVLLLFLISTKVVLRDCSAYREMRRYSVGLYFLHIPIRWIILNITDNSQMVCLLVFGIGCLICFLAYRNKNGRLASLLS